MSATGGDSNIGGGGGAMGDAGVGDTRASGSASTVVTFTIENLLYTAALTASCWFASHYFTFLRIPALVFMFVDSVSVMASLHAVSTILIFSIRPKRVGGAFSDCVLAEASQGFAVIASLMWLGVLWCMFLDVPRITAVPGFPASASAIALAVVLGFAVVIPFLALVVTYAAVPSGSGNSLVFNGSTLGAACLLFFVTLSFGNGGVMKCSPYDGTSSGMSFGVLVFAYWCILLCVELLVFAQWDPIESIWELLGNDVTDYEYYTDFLHSSWVHISIWRIIGCIVDIVIVASSLLYTHEPVRATVLTVMFVVAVLHVPLIFTIKFDLFGGEDGQEQEVEWAKYAGDEPDTDRVAVAYPPKNQSVYGVEGFQSRQNSGVADLFPFNRTPINTVSSVGRKHRRRVNPGGDMVF